MQSVHQPMKPAPAVAQHGHQPRHIRSTRLVCGIVFLLICLLSRDHLWHHSDYQSLSSHCAGIAPISNLEYHIRQTNLAKTLHALNASAYITEPSANSQYFANFSTAQWFLSERPLLLIITPSFDGGVESKIAILTPQFEATRAKTLPLPNDANEVKYVEWAEDEDPYYRAISILPNQGSSTIFVDNSIRKFIVDGLQRAYPSANVYSAPFEITQMRERKSKPELEILQCANEATLLAIREVHKQLYLGIRESEARRMMAAALSAAGLQDGECLTLFGDNAALPHGSGTDKSLGIADFALFDCGGSLHGYYSDITRTVALPDSKIPDEHLHIWGSVHTAQSVALNAAKDGVVTSIVDAVARSSLQAAGYAPYFTHRLGHGIGLEGHEQPYLRGGTNDIIRIGHTFSDEPGVYIEGKVGVRLEDCFYIAEDGTGVYLTQNVGGQTKSPWQP